MFAKPIHQAMAAVLILLVCLVLNEIFRPFDEERQNYRWAMLRWLDLWSICANIAIMWCGVLVASEQSQVSARGGEISFGTEILVWMCALLNIGVFCFGIWKFGYETYREKLHLIKIVETPFEHMTKKQQEQILKMVEMVVHSNNQEDEEMILTQMKNRLSKGDLTHAAMGTMGSMGSKRGTIRSGVVVRDGDYGDDDVDDVDDTCVVVAVEGGRGGSGGKEHGGAVLKRCEAYVAL